MKAMKQEIILHIKYFSLTMDDGIISVLIIMLICMFSKISKKTTIRYLYKNEPLIVFLKQSIGKIYLKTVLTVYTFL
jgi:hypothetical protein